jgi:uncharacterized protein YjbI with pentapeptide repeats
LKGFFWLGPALFLVMHCYVFLHLALLAGKVGQLNAELRARVPDHEVRARLRRQLPINPFVQILAGPREVRQGVLGLMLRLVAIVTLMLGPVALLLSFQLQFLPFHDELISSWHRAAVAADLALLWLFLPAITRGGGVGAVWRGLRAATLIPMLSVSLLPLLLVFWIATFPGERLDASRPAFLHWLHEKLVAGETDLVSRKLDSLWSNVLVLPGLGSIEAGRLDGEVKNEPARQSLSLRGRHLEGAVLIGASLFRADLTEARLSMARLDGADLREATLDGADLRGATLDTSRLQGAHLDRARLQGADLEFAHLQGSSLRDANLQGADLAWANLNGASLFRSDLQGASFEFSDLRVGNFYRASLQGASLDAADIRGAVFRSAQLQGAEFHDTRRGGTDFGSAFVWRVESAGETDNIADGTVTAPRHSLEKGGKLSDCLEPKTESFGFTCQWSSASFHRLESLVAREIPDEHPRLRHSALVRLRKRLDPAKAEPNEERWAKQWQDLERDGLPKDFENARRDQLVEVSCEPEGAPYVVRRLLEEGSYDPTLATRVLDVRSCAGARKFGEDLKDRLRLGRVLGPVRD